MSRDKMLMVKKKQKTLPVKSFKKNTLTVQKIII